MPDLTFRRDGAHPPVKAACVYCGRPAAHARTWDVVNPRLDPPAGGGRYELPRGGGDDLGCVAVVFLPLLLVNMVMDARDGFRRRAAAKAAPPLVPPTTTVTTRTCDRHRRFGRRFVWAAVVGFLAVAAAWGGAAVLRHQPGGAPLWLVMAALIGSVGFPLVLPYVWATAGPVRVSFVGRDAVVLSHVRQAYFDAPG